MTTDTMLDLEQFVDDGPNTSDPVYPVVIYATRWGIYERAKYAAFHLDQVPLAAYHDKKSAIEFWSSHDPAIVIGRGETPDDAYHDLVGQIMDIP